MFKKGDKVVMIGSWDNNGAWYAKELTIESWGKKQGTATNVNNKFIKENLILSEINSMKQFSPQYIYQHGSVNPEEKAVELAIEYIANRKLKDAEPSFIGYK